jgi:hypothetical protein
MNTLHGEIINLTPHAITLLNKETDEVIATIPYSGTEARVSETNTVIGKINGIALVKKEFGEIAGLPDFKEGVYYIVSLPTANAAKAHGRTTQDLLVTNDPKRVRNEDGSTTIAGCYSFSIIE